jgi:LCP family protein required for cell wall assembly
MFEQLDDPARFEPGESFFAETSRRFAGRRRRTAAARAVGGIVCLAAVVPVLLATRGSNPVDGTRPVEDPTVADPVGNSTAQETTPASSEPTQTFPPAYAVATNFLFVGTDNVSCSGADVRTDTIMVLRLDPTNHRAAVLSFPRDLWVDVPGRGKARINSAYRPNDPQLLIDTLLAEFGVHVDHFIQLDYCGFKKLVDAIGGVTVPIVYPLRDESTGLSVPEAGCTSFDGNTALAYVRSRHLEYQDSRGVWHEDPTSDLGRIARQQDFVERFLQSASSAGVLDPSTISRLYDVVRNDLVIDIGLTLDKMINFVKAISQVAPTDMRNYQIEVTAKLVAGSAVLVLNKNSAAMKPILDIFRGVAPLANDPQQAGAADTAAIEPVGNAPESNSPDTAIVPEASIIC